MRAWTRRLLLPLGAALLGGLAACQGMAAGGRLTDEGSTPPPAAPPSVPAPTAAPVAAPAPPPTSDTGSRWLAPSPVGAVSVETPPFDTSAAPAAASRVPTSAPAATTTPAARPAGPPPAVPAPPPPPGALPPDWRPGR